jgi:hypothetical protein
MMLLVRNAPVMQERAATPHMRAFSGLPVRPRNRVHRKSPDYQGFFRSRPVSRILSGVTISLGHRLPGGSSSAPGSSAGRVDGACFALHQTGFGSRRVTAALVGSYPTFSPLPSASPESFSLLAVSFLCHFPSAFAAWGFPSVLPFGVRTFLGPAHAGPRSPGLQLQL